MKIIHYLFIAVAEIMTLVSYDKKGIKIINLRKNTWEEEQEEEEEEIIYYNSYKNNY